MNIVLFEAGELDRVLPLGDPRAEHVLRVLRRREGESFDVGLIDGPKGKATLTQATKDGLRLAFDWGVEEPPLLPIDLVVGLSRPQTNRKILNEATTLGVRSIRFARTERGEPSYLESKLWSTGEWRRHLVAGAAQAFSTRLPEVKFGQSLEEALQELQASAGAAVVALDNYEGTSPLQNAFAGCAGVILLVGSERGWTAGERDCLRERGVALAHLGERVLRTETAVVAAVALARAAIGR